MEIVLVSVVVVGVIKELVEGQLKLHTLVLNYLGSDPGPTLYHPYDPCLHPLICKFGIIILSTS